MIHKEEWGFNKLEGLKQSGQLLDEQSFAIILELITHQTGIIPRDSHMTGIKKYVEKRLQLLNQDGASYLHILEKDPDELASLFNSATVNETYFFREEAQFDVFQQKVLPKLKENAALTIPRKPVRIWSAACSTGEEIYSILLLADSLGIKTECTASDINTTVLETCKKGVYKKNAVRTVDGAKYHHLLEDFKSPSGEFVLPEKLCSRISTKRINLSSMTDFPVNQDVIFVRNVFIYFSNDMKKQVLKKIAEDSLAPGGYLFVSMNEVAVLDSLLLPECLEQVVDGKVFYFHKKAGK